MLISNEIKGTGKDPFRSEGELLLQLEGTHGGEATAKGYKCISVRCIKCQRRTVAGAGVAGVEAPVRMVFWKTKIVCEIGDGETRLQQTAVGQVSLRNK